MNEQGGNYRPASVYKDPLELAGRKILQFYKHLPPKGPSKAIIRINCNISYQPIKSNWWSIEAHETQQSVSDEHLLLH